MKTRLSRPDERLLRRPPRRPARGRAASSATSATRSCSTSSPRTRARSRSPKSATPSALASTGESKLDEMVALEYVELLLDKTIGRFVPVKLVQFGAIGMLGVGVHLAAALPGAERARRSPSPSSQAAAVIGAMTFNFALEQPLHLSRPAAQGPRLGRRPALLLPRLLARRGRQCRHRQPGLRAIPRLVDRRDRRRDRRLGLELCRQRLADLDPALSRRCFDRN